ncbi:MAG: hypothetical protein OXG53_17850 [Chloroflexi bacterium]|nr:hypothetical protein [Chloroflexota bacterium]
MATYMSISADLRTSEDMIAIIEALLSDSKIGIASICSFSQSKNADKWFLSGYAIESILGRFSKYMRMKPSEITIVPDSNRNVEYLVEIKQIITERRKHSEFSPFETRRGEYTFIDQSLQTFDLSGIRSWINERNVARVYVYPFVVNSGPSTQFPFRHRFVDWRYEPVIELCLTKHPKMGHVFSLYSSSQVWLERGFAPLFDGLPNADENLRTLNQLAEHVLPPINSNELTIGLSGSVFHDESERIEKCFRRFNVIVEKG